MTYIERVPPVVFREVPIIKSIKKLSDGNWEILDENNQPVFHGRGLDLRGMDL